jgi:hypothetical protein
MKEVSVHRDSAIVGYHKSILESAGILCFIRNEHTSATFGAGAMGLVQSHLFDPALCITDDSRYDEAISLIKSSTANTSEGKADWKCDECGEVIPGSFDYCWNCPEAAGESEAGEKAHP